MEELNKIKREFNIARYFAIGTGAGCAVLLIMLFGAYASVSRYRSSKKNGKKKSNSGNANSGRSQSGQTLKRAEKAPERRENKTINYVMGLDKPNTGIVFALTVSFVEGLGA